MEHPDLEYHVDAIIGGEPIRVLADENGRWEPVGVFDTFDAAADAISDLPELPWRVRIDACAWSEEGAEVHGGDDAAASYREDPDCSILERLTVRRGRVLGVPHLDFSRPESEGRIA